MGSAWFEKKSAIAEIFGIGVGIAEIVVDQDGGLAGQFETLSALETSDEIVEPNHVGSGFGKFSAVFVTSAARQLSFLARNFPTNGKLKFAAAAWADQLDFSGLFLFGIKRAFVHG